MNIVITGVTRGLGRALAREFIAGGHTVFGCGTNGEAIFDLRLEYGAPNDFALVDVAQDVKVSIWATSVLAGHPAPDLLINNAAVINPPGPLWTQGDAAFTRLVDVNLRGVANVIRHFVPAMVQRGSGVIVNLSSGWGRSVSPDVAPYCMSKWGIEGLTKALAAELPAGMAAVPLNPGVIDTDMLRTVWSGGAAEYPKAEVWAKRAAPYLLSLSARDNGRSLSVPGAED
jgi:NAD(P)-dependent dehydrogenase (short-subunit alcohol dehydrogenase family)